MTDAPIRWAVVGTSRFALDWAAAGIRRAPNAELVAIVGRDPERARAAANEVGAPLHATSIEALERDTVDAVHLVVPNPQHAPLTAAAAGRGFHVLVEKPMAATTAECRRMIDVARANEVRLFVAHCMSWTAPADALREALAGGRVGRPVLATVSLGFDARPSDEWRQQLPTEEGGGPLFDLGAHAIHLLLDLFGPVVTVAGSLHRVAHDYPADDLALATLAFDGGPVVSLRTSFASHHDDLAIDGPDGRLESAEWLLRDGPGHLAWRRGWWTEPQPCPLEPVNVFERQAIDVSDAIRTGRASRHAEPEAGLEVVAVIEAIVRSARDGGRAVRLR